MTTFTLFIYFLLNFAPSGLFSPENYTAIERAFQAGTAETSRQAAQSSPQLMPPAPVTVQPLTQLPGAEFSPVVAAPVAPVVIVTSKRNKGGWVTVK